MGSFLKLIEFLAYFERENNCEDLGISKNVLLTVKNIVVHNIYPNFFTTYT